MRYWDSSALVPLLVEEPSSASLRLLMREDGHIATWSWSRTEVVSAIERRCRESSDSRTQRQKTLAEFADFAASWDEFSDILDIQSRTHDLLARHPLRAADAGHLATALILRALSNEPFDFVCLDNRLSNAAELEGFRVVPEPSARQH